VVPRSARVIEAGGSPERGQDRQEEEEEEEEEDPPANNKEVAYPPLVDT